MAPALSGKLLGLSDKPPQEAVSDDELIASIKSDVMACLAEKRFFEKLDDLLCAADRSEGYSCKHTFAITESILRSLHFDKAAIADIVGVLKSQGACCDCEVLYNVAENTRLKARYWKSKAKDL